ncbi:type II toxin-antitoxin system HipA family toxin [Pseudomonas sp. Pseu.R1]|uniref:type II toxin-antitoxin system HipA family toxin n=1 Tax=Pseudomonas sp. Pseu.R1 TaxID=3379818 RepID=UPI003B94A919
MNLTLQLYASGQWQDVMRIEFEKTELGQNSPCNFGYDQHYLVEHLGHLGRPTAQSVSARIPLAWDLYRTPGFPAFLLDILPSGAARRFLLARLSIPEKQGASADLALLQRCTPAPIGHLRIKESVETLGQHTGLGFDRAEVIARDSRFLEYAYEQGAAVGGATGAGGEAPKLLLAEDARGLMHPDATLADEAVRQHWFVKFSRNNGNATDRTILRSEFCYYQALAKIGMNVVPCDGMRLEEARKPSLWMRRFDRKVDENGVSRLGVESVYSLADVTRPGSYMTHPQAVAALAQAWSANGQQNEIPQMVAEYVRRDLINQVLGNSDNHGRNTSILREETRLSLAPIYDLAPMVMDEEGVTRTTKWPDPIERAGEVEWLAACRSLAAWADPDQLFERLRADAKQLLALPDLLNEGGLPQQTFKHPRVALSRLQATFQTWGLA